LNLSNAQAKLKRVAHLTGPPYLLNLPLNPYSGSNVTTSKTKGPCHLFRLKGGVVPAWHSVIGLLR
jgi:hypothetical protein